MQTIPDQMRVTRLSCVLFQAIVRSRTNSCVPMSKFYCVHVQTFVRAPDYRAFMSRSSCVQVQTFVRLFEFPDRVILNVRRPLVRSFRSGHIRLRSGTSTLVQNSFSANAKINLINREFEWQTEESSTELYLYKGHIK